MANKIESDYPIEVVTIFDGSRDATELFTALIKEKYQRRRKPLAIPELTVHNKSESPTHPASELCG